jgi:hypothetical protein
VVWVFEGNLWRRGVDVNIPEIGSRGARNCFGGIQRFYAELRRELFWGNWNLGFYSGFRVDAWRRGGTMCSPE